MRKINGKKVTVTILVLLMIFLTSQSVFAATNFKAFSVYRKKDSVVSYEWHAGIMQATDCTNSGNPVIHATDQNTYCVDAVSWSSYMSDMSTIHFKGVYRPNVTMSSTKKNYVVDTAQDLASTNIKYVLTRQLDYDTSNMDASKVLPSEVKKIRCDGVIEYSYEYNDVRICGPSGSSGWNISVKNATTYGYGDDFTPYQQATEFMTLVQYEIPSAN